MGGGWWVVVAGGGGGWVVVVGGGCGWVLRKNVAIGSLDSFGKIVFSSFSCWCFRGFCVSVCFFFVCLSSGRKVVELFAVSFHSRGYDLAGPVNYATCSIGWC